VYTRSSINSGVILGIRSMHCGNQYLFLWGGEYSKFCFAIISRVAIQSIERKRVFKQACCLTHLSVCQSVGRSVDLSGGWIAEKRLIGPGCRSEWWVGRSMDGCIRWGSYRRRGRGNGSFWGEFGACHCNQWWHSFVVVRERRTLPKLLWGGLVLVSLSVISVIAVYFWEARYVS